MELTNESDGILIRPKDNDTPITLYILTKPRNRGLSTSSERVSSKVLKETG